MASASYKPALAKVPAFSKAEVARPDTGDNVFEAQFSAAVRGMIAPMIQPLLSFVMSNHASLAPLSETQQLAYVLDRFKLKSAPVLSTETAIPGLGAATPTKKTTRKPPGLWVTPEEFEVQRAEGGAEEKALCSYSPRTSASEFKGLYCALPAVAINPELNPGSDWTHWRCNTHRARPPATEKKATKTAPVGASASKLVLPGGNAVKAPPKSSVPPPRRAPIIPPVVAPVEAGIIIIENPSLVEILGPNAAVITSEPTNMVVIESLDSEPSKIFGRVPGDLVTKEFVFTIDVLRSLIPPSEEEMQLLGPGFVASDLDFGSEEEETAEEEIAEEVAEE